MVGSSIIEAPLYESASLLQADALASHPSSVWPSIKILGRGVRWCRVNSSVPKLRSKPNYAINGTKLQRHRFLQNLRNIMGAIDVALFRLRSAVQISNDRLCHYEVSFTFVGSGNWRILIPSDTSPLPPRGTPGETRPWHRTYARPDRLRASPDHRRSPVEAD
jgi:hypothetical protein